MKKATIVNSSLLALLAVSLTACVGVQNVKSDYQLDPSSKKGLVVGTLTLARSTYSAPIFYFQSSDKTVSESIAFSESFPTRRPRTDLPGRLSKLFIVELPVGSYNFYRLRFPSGAALGYVWIDLSSTSSQSVSFDVEAGKVTYVGDLFIDAQSSNLRGTWVNSIKVRDFLDQDKREFIKAHSWLADTDLKTSLFRIGSSN